MPQASRYLQRVARALAPLWLLAATAPAQAIDLRLHLHFEDFVTGGQQAHEIDLVGWGVTLRDAANTALAAGTSDADGDVLFTVATAGTYTAVLTVPAPYPYDPDSTWPTNLAFPFVIPSNPTPPSFTLRIFLRCACNDADLFTPDACTNGPCALTLTPRPAVAERCDAIDNDCDGDVNEGLPTPCTNTPTVIGCADGTREGFLTFPSYPLIASCGGAWTVPDPLAPPACARQAGNHGVLAAGTGCAAVDLCPAGWHVCYGPDDVAARVGGAGCSDAVDPHYPNFGTADLAPDLSLPPGGAFFATRARAYDGVCADGVNPPEAPQDLLALLAADNVFGCGNLGAAPSLACGDLDRAANTLCAWLQDMADALVDNPATDYGYALLAEWAWSCGASPGAELASLVKAFPDRQGGVLCCRDTDPSLPEVCDGLDNDGDGLTDETDLFGASLALRGGPCPLDGQCGLTVCTAEGDFACVDPGPCDDTTCDGVDDDHDGTPDDDYTPAPTTCGLGVCAATGLTACLAGDETNGCVPAPKAEPTDLTCDGRDGDCDGQTDEDFTPGPASCGLGACASTGTLRCVAGAPVSDCVPGAPLGASDASCDAVDGDCDGQTDEDWVGTPTSCGQGVCARTAVSVCAAGVVTSGCTPGNPTLGSDATCNGLDEDCDGQTDEQFTSAPSNCGFGACRRAGVLTCVAGALRDSCVPGVPLGFSDATCDNVDDDCDNHTDEEWPGAGPSTCGLGVCARTGVVSCSGGLVIDTCTPGAALSGNDPTCDGVDDDCDGLTDESWSGATPTTCGAGACAATGAPACVAGAVADSCTPKPRLAPTDLTCDGVDDDCDGQTDEDFVPLATACGEGVCARTGALRCQGGVLVDDCEAGEPERDHDPSCDGFDEDCDGETDEDYPREVTRCGVGACADGTGERACVDGEVVNSCDPLSSCCR